MKSYRLSSAAAADLMDIAFYGDKTYGLKKSSQYRDGLKKQFEEAGFKSLSLP